MELFDLIKTRRSVREFLKKPIPKEVLEKIVRAGIWAPSAMNRQPWRFVVVQDPKSLKLLSTAAKEELMKFLQTREAEKQYGKSNVSHFMPHADGDDMIFYNAPAIVFVIDTLGTGDHFDHGLATENMMLMAHGLGVGSCCIGLSTPIENSEKVRTLLGMDEKEKVVIGVIFGYPSEKPHETQRKFDVVKWLS
jgi:nitroreductase